MQVNVCVFVRFRLFNTLFRHSFALSMNRSFLHISIAVDSTLFLVSSALIKFNMCISVFWRSIYCILLFVISTKLNTKLDEKFPTCSIYGALGFNLKTKSIFFQRKFSSNFSFSHFEFVIQIRFECQKNVIEKNRLFYAQYTKHFRPFVK